MDELIHLPPPLQQRLPDTATCIIFHTDAQKAQRLREQLHTFYDPVYLTNTIPELVEMITEHYPDTLLVDMEQATPALQTRLKAIMVSALELGHVKHICQWVEEDSGLTGIDLNRFHQQQGMTRKPTPESKSRPLLPSSQAPAVVTQSLPVDSSHSPKTQLTNDKMHILVIEDYKINQIVARGMLSKLGYNVTTVDSGFKALDLLQTQRGFDLILMDIQMPGMSGVETTRKLRALYPDWSVPILALTANALKDDEVEYLQAGMDECLTKPIQMDKLKTTIARWCPVPA